MKNEERREKEVVVGGRIERGETDEGENVFERRRGPSSLTGP